MKKHVRNQKSGLFSYDSNSLTTQSKTSFNVNNNNLLNNNNNKNYIENYNKINFSYGKVRLKKNISTKLNSNNNSSKLFTNINNYNDNNINNNNNELKNITSYLSNNKMNFMNNQTSNLTFYNQPILSNSSSSLKKKKTIKFNNKNLINRVDRLFIRKQTHKSSRKISNLDIDSILNTSKNEIDDSPKNTNINKNNKIFEKEQFWILSNIKNDKKNLKHKKTKSINIPVRDLIKRDPYRLLNPIVKINISLFTELSKKYQSPNLRNTIRTIEKNKLNSLKGTSIFLKNKENKQPNLITRLINILHNKNIHEDFRYAVKWKSLVTLFNEFTFLVLILLESFKDIKSFFEKNQFINKEQLREILINMRLNIKRSLIDKFINCVFGIFCEDYEKLDIKIFFCALIIINPSMMYEDKIDYLCNIWEKNGEIKLYDMLLYIKENIRFKKDYPVIKAYFLNEYKDQKNIVLLKEEVFSHFVFHKYLRKIYSANLIIDFYKVDKIYNEELYNEFSKNMRGFNYRINQRDINCYSNFLTKNYEKILEIVERTDNKKNEIKMISKDL